MLYLAEVQKRPSGFGLGGGRTDLKLLACQREENNWTAVSGDEIIPADEAKEFTPGALVLVDLSNNKQVQQIQEAARQLVKILQNFSRSQEKFKTQWDEIEQWKASLTFQAQELNRREMELQAKEEQLEQLEGELERLEQQRQEVNQSVEESQRLRETVEGSRQEIEDARARLQQEIEEFENTKAQLSQTSVLDESQSSYIKELLDWLSGAIAPTGSAGEQLNSSLETIASLQELLQQHWQQLEEKRAAAEQKQQEVDGLSRDIDSRWLSWQEGQKSLSEQRLELKSQQSLLESKHEYAGTLQLQLQTQEQLSQQLSQLVAATGLVAASDKVDMAALENMPIEQLQEMVDNLQHDLQKDIRFVNDQEEELAYQRQEIEELQAKINQATEYDRLSLENDLAEQQENYKFLNESLLGSQRNLRERQEVMGLHQSVLRQRQGVSLAADSQEAIDLGPLVSQVEAQRKQVAEALQQLEEGIERIQSEISQKQGSIDSRLEEQEADRNEIKQLEQNFMERKTAVAELWGQVNLYQEMLQPMQDNFDDLRRKLQETGESLEGMQDVGQQLEQLRQVLEGLIS